MPHRTLVALVSGAIIVLISSAASVAEPIRLARHPDYHAGRIAFAENYLAVTYQQKTTDYTRN